MKAGRGLGEVVEATTTEFVAQCYELYTAPALGSLVRCGDDEAIYGIVHEIGTRSIDAGRRPIARGRDEDDEDAIYEANPQLSRLLSTEFRALSVGYIEDGTLRRWLAPLPASDTLVRVPVFRGYAEGVQRGAGFRVHIAFGAHRGGGRRAGGFSEDGGRRASRPRGVPGERGEGD